MKLDARIVIGLAVLAMFIGATLIADVNSGRDDYIVSGYDGIIAEITDVDQGDNGGVVDNDGTKATLNPPKYWTVFTPLVGVDPTTVICEIDAAVDVLKNETETLFNKWQNVTYPSGVTTYEHVVVNQYSCLMGVTLMTDYTGGLDGLQGKIIYTIELGENDFSIFTDANETYAAMVQVWMRTPATVVGIGSVSPSSGGYAFPMTTVRIEQPPEWLSQIGYNTNSMKKLSVVEVSFTLNSIQPTSWMGIMPANSQISFLIGIDVVLAGEWVRTSYHGWEPPPVPPGVFDWLINGLYAFGAAVLNGLSTIGLTTLWPIAVIVVVFLVVYLGLFRRHG